MAAAVTNAVKEGLPATGSYFNTLLSAIRARPGKRSVNHTIKKAVEDGHLPHVIECIQQPRKTGVDIKSPGVLAHTIRGLRVYPQREQYSAQSLKSALNRSRVLATLLDCKDKGYGRTFGRHDPRRSPELLGAYLEIVAADAVKNNSSASTKNVKVSAERLLNVFELDKTLMQQDWVVPKKGPVNVVLDNFPVWHGLTLAQRVLKDDMPHSGLAQQIIQTYGQGIEKIVGELRSLRPNEESYRGEAIWIWDNRIQ